MVPALDAHGFRWAIGGAVALQLHGIERATKDVDLFVHDGDRRILQLFRDNDAPSGMVSGNYARVTNPCDRGEHVDVVFPSFAYLEASIGRAQRVDVGEVIVPVLAPLDLAVCKALSESPKDGRDLALLVAAGVVSDAAIRSALPASLPARVSHYVLRHQNVPLALERLDVLLRGGFRIG